MELTDKLTADARSAKDAALAACAAVDDGGTSNLDATFFRLEKGARSERIVAAIQAAGLRAEATRWLGRGVMVQPPGGGQAGKRWASNQALYACLRDAGWPVTPYYQMD